MNNPGMDAAVWEQLRNKWTRLEKAGHKLKVDFEVIKESVKEGQSLAIDVIQTIDDVILVETVQHSTGEAYSLLGIAKLSLEELVQGYKKVLHDLYRRVKKEKADLIVVMTPHSGTAGETMGYLQQPGTDTMGFVALNYQHYYMLNAMREKMIELVGDGWSQVRAIYHTGDVEFYFDYPEIGAE